MKGVWFDILPRMVGLQAEADKVVAESEKAGEKAGSAFSRMFSDKATSATAKSVESMKAQVNSGVSALESASARAVSAHDREADAAGRARIAEANLAAVRQKYSEDSVQYVRAEEALAKAKRDTATASGVAQDAAVAENRVMDDLAAKQTALKAKQDELAASSGRLGTVMKGTATLGVGALIYGFGEAIKKGAEFDQKMTLIQTSAGEQGSNIGMLKKGVLDLSSQWGDSATETEDALLRIERAGYHGSDALKVLSASMQQAKSENAPLVDVSDQLTTSMKDFGVQVKDVNSAASVNVATMANFKGTMEDFASSVGSVEETAHNTGMSMNGLYSVLDEMTQHGFTAQRATDDLNHAIQKLESPTSGMRDELGQFGISVTDLQKQLADPKIGLAGAMENVSEAIMKKMGPSGQVLLNSFNQSKDAAKDAGAMLAGMDQQAQAVAQTFMQSGGNLHKMSLDLSAKDQGQLAQWAARYKDATGFNQALKSGAPAAQSFLQAMKATYGDSTTLAVAQNLTGENFADYQRINAFNQAEGKPTANGDVRGADQANATLQSRIGALKSTVGNALTNFGDSKQGAAITTVNGLVDTIQWLEKHQGVLKDVLTVSTTIGTMWASWKISAGITQGITALKAGFTALLPATEAETAAAGEMDVAMDANPIGAVVVAVEALIGVGVLLYENWDKVTKAWDWAYKNVFTPVGHWFQHVWSDDIVPPFNTATSDISKWFKSMGDDVHGVWVDIVHGVAWTVDKIADAFDVLPSAIHIPGTNISTPDFKAMGRELHAFATAGMDYKADGGEIIAHPGYGLFHGKGGTRDDANLVAMSNHEWVVDAEGATRNRDVLERIKRGEKILARADGGLIGDDSTLSADPASASATASSSTASAQSGLQIALNAIRDHISTMYEWGGGNLSTGVDCSGLVGDAQLLATGGQPDHRLGNTDTLLQGGWPGMIKGATSSDYFVAGVNDHHMVASILGQNIEARQSGEHIRMGSDAASPFDSQFIAQYHLDPSLIQPPYQPGASGDPTATGGDFTSLGVTGSGATASDRAAKYRAAAQKELDLAKKHDAMAQADMTKAAQFKDGLPAAKAKHLDAMKRYLQEAQHADELAAKSTGAAKQRHLDAAAHDRDLAAKAQAAAGKVSPQGQHYLDMATKARQEAADERKRAQEDMAKADKAMNTPTKTKGSKSSVDTNGGWMTFKQFNEHLADVATDFITDETGMPSWISDPNQSAVLRIGKQLTNIRPKGKTWTAPNWGASPFLPATNDQTDQQDLSSLLPATHDLGGPIPPGLSLVNNKTGGDEVLVINPQLMGQRHPEPVAASSRGRGRRDAPYVQIDKWIAGSNDQAEANRLGRTVGQYSRQR